MRNNRRVTYQQKQIKQLQEKIKLLENENKSLMRENTSLHNINETNKQTIEKMTVEYKKSMDLLSQSIVDANEIRAKYMVSVKDIVDLKKQYADKMSDLLKRLKKQKN